MEISKFVGTGALANRLGVPQTRIRQLEREGAIPEGRRLEPGNRRVWDRDEVESIAAVIEKRRASRKEALATT
jgi:DNA-binding transcriptional MerR regulator